MASALSAALARIHRLPCPANAGHPATAKPSMIERFTTHRIHMLTGSSAFADDDGTKDRVAWCRLQRAPVDRGRAAAGCVPRC